MSKKINFGTINAESMEKLSCYHQAFAELKNLRTEYKKSMGELEAEESKILANRATDIEAGLPLEEVIRKWSTEKIREKMRKLEAEYRKSCEPWNKAKKEAMSLIDDKLYLAYVLCMNKGDLGAKGTLQVTKGKATEEHNIDKSFKTIVCDFLTEIGCKNQDNDTALSKFAQTMTVRTAGMRKNNKGADYVTVKSASQFKELFFLTFFQYVIVEKGVLTVNEDNTLSMTVYDAE